MLPLVASLTPKEIGIDFSNQMQATRSHRILSMVLNRKENNQQPSSSTKKVSETAVFTEFSEVYKVSATDGTLIPIEGDFRDTTHWHDTENNSILLSNFQQPIFQDEVLGEVAHEYLVETDERTENTTSSFAYLEQSKIQQQIFEDEVLCKDTHEHLVETDKVTENTNPDTYFKQTALLEIGNLHLKPGSSITSEDSNQNDDDYILEEDPECSDKTANNEEKTDSSRRSHENKLNEENRIRRRKRKADVENWNRQATKSRRMHGVEYAGFQRNKDRKVSYGIKRPERKIRDRCVSLACTKSTKHFCGSFSEEERNLMFRTFWGKMDWQEKKAYITGNMEYTKTKRSSKGKEPSRRSGTYYYYLRNKTNEKKRVCKKMFLNTFDLKEDMVHDWFKKTEHGLICIREENSNTSADQRRSNNFNKGKRNCLVDWFNMLPKMASHYCRKDTKKKYLETIFQTKAQLYREYLKHCDNNSLEKLSYAIFDQIFCDLNLSLYQPKKDWCDTCSAFEVKNIDQFAYASHIERKNLAREEKAKDKEDAINHKNYTFTMDLQAVKSCPVLNASAIYYKKKLTVHNFTMKIENQNIMKVFSEEKAIKIVLNININNINLYDQDTCDKIGKHTVSSTNKTVLEKCNLIPNMCISSTNKTVIEKCDSIPNVCGSLTEKTIPSKCYSLSDLPVSASNTMKKTECNEIRLFWLVCINGLE
ncbi:unnamed protein product [Diabrotica balteata]|uniref:Uncharacterized protein n=1 Tax=Diabrotica balteata TaxID=107213 RepID=A0A9N9X4R1_DIABA|nr:unnamed protein product [Diabrotica balteata]